MQLGTSLRFLFPTSEQTYSIFRATLDALPPGGFIERPMGALSTQEQAKNLLEIADAVRDANLDTLLVGDAHAVPPGYANAFSPIPTLGQLMPRLGAMTTGAVLLAPFYHPVLLAEQLGTLAAFAGGPLVVTLANGQGDRQFGAFGMTQRSRSGRLEELVPVLRDLLAGEQVSVRGRYHQLEQVQTGPTARVPVSLWIAGTVAAAAERAGRIGDGWLSGQNATRPDLVQQLDLYRESAARHGRPVRPVLRRDIYVGETDREAERVVNQILTEGYRGGGLDRLLVGSAESVVQQLEEYRALGFDHVMVRHIVSEQELILGSFERIGKAVLPRLHALQPLT
jgi:alkanesulfonate monooxygenase SsuD/methylene tetrahydromethanopterin reductase-like flavin-dependent oxidoreductase (luciferase family)